ncbi:hypothetical protein HDV05_000713 [Chytridiales sp. JEL 0842]|nr:hypothetical protein HDV05_000713 [Chytridiales sp. JEL 0842]
MRRPHLVTFDAFNTLFKVRGSVASQYLTHLRSLGIPTHNVSDTDIQEAFLKAYRELDRKEPVFGRGTGGEYEGWWNKVIHTTLTTAGIQTAATSQSPSSSSSMHKISTSLFHYFSTSQPFELLPNAKETLHALKTGSHKKFQVARGGAEEVVVGVVSNSDPRTGRVLRELGLGEGLVDFVVTSYEASHSKPAPQIFDLALQKANQVRMIRNYHSGTIQPHECVHVGDCAERDLGGALGAGWNGVLVGEGEGGVERVLDVKL